MDFHSFYLQKDMFKGRRTFKISKHPFLVVTKFYSYCKNQKTWNGKLFYVQSIIIFDRSQSPFLRLPGELRVSTRCAGTGFGSPGTWFRLLHHSQYDLEANHLNASWPFPQLEHCHSTSVRECELDENNRWETNVLRKVAKGYVYI